MSINQPYWIPYLGYFALIAKSDKFVVLDSVKFSRASWVARNWIHIGDEAVRNTIPLQSASQNSRIIDLRIDNSQKWRERTLRTLTHTFRRNTLNRPVFEMVESWFASNETNLSRFLSRSIQDICFATGISSEFVPSDTLVLPDTQQLLGQERIIKLARNLGADTYINLPSGRSLYDGKAFDKAKISLTFLSEMKKEVESASAPFRSVLHHLLEVGFDETAERIARICE